MLNRSEEWRLFRSVRRRPLMVDVNFEHPLQIGTNWDKATLKELDSAKFSPSFTQLAPLYLNRYRTACICLRFS